ncbi:glycosyltransferase family 1 protein [Vagococcus hydrophili]|uniref:Glycosyltransferase family 1 protein n=1 Tax=Vagococcus hydrophili TaxID=2714947 RepID=A0A6G8AR70_9ENTE|nr:glycosyltransferase family 1 protein [Vagococcus hydrophili]QIL47425.1 glycosyltransferase family 1 protein [Vagococcus hydrophili]
MGKPLRVMQIGMTPNQGGLESYIMSMYRSMDREKIQFDFFSFKDEKIAYQAEIENLGGKVYDVGYKRRNILNHYLRFPFFFFKNHPEIDVVHFHKTSLIDIEYIMLSYFSKVPVRIIHSHSSGNMFSSGKLVKNIEKWNKKKINKFVTDKFACSELAGEWLFNDKNYKVVKNAIKLEKFRFNKNKRVELRNKFKLDDKCLVIGHIGYFTPVKNHEFILEMFKSLLKENENSCLILIGDGILKKNIEDLAIDLDIQNKIKFLGVTDDVSSLLSMMDVFILPSKFEGLPISAVEAQCSGLPTLLSDKITKEVKLTERCQFLSLNDINLWVTTIKKYRENTIDRESVFYKLKEQGFDIDDEAKKMANFYVESIKNKEI